LCGMIGIGAAQLGDVVEAMRDEDTSAGRHRAANMLWFRRAGLDTELAEALYAVDADPDNRPLYTDAAATLAALHRFGTKVAVVSDIHLDLRTMLARQGVGDFVDEFVLSFELGCQKPDARMFLTALDVLDVDAARTLMVGDRCSHDGGAAAVGIATLILPPPPPVNGPRGLDAVVRLLAHQ
jgi:HAD superfamily hydrolase (TIGR01549 family)